MSRLKRHAISFWIEVDCCGDGVLSIVLAHLNEDQVCTFLVDLDLGLDYHVIYQSDEGAEAVVVSLSELEYSVLQLIFLLLQHHGLMFGCLAHLGMLEVFFFFESS